MKPACPTIGGFIVREYNDKPSNYRYTRTLADVMRENNIPGIEGVDTRASSPACCATRAA